jgi:hypothetical protein
MKPTEPQNALQVVRLRSCRDWCSPPAPFAKLESYAVLGNSSEHELVLGTARTPKMKPTTTKSMVGVSPFKGRLMDEILDAEYSVDTAPFSNFSRIANSLSTIARTR